VSDGAGSARFSNANRNIAEEEEIRLTTVGVDIGSSTSHLVFSRIVMERFGARYIVSKRETLHEAPITLTPYLDGADIDAAALGAFVDASFESAGLARGDIDTGALILTGVAVRRRNARAIADLFAAEAGKFVAVSAGDGLEATMAAHGSGAVLRSARGGGLVVNIDIGGGTTKIAHCRGGKVSQVTALDAGARLVVVDQDGTIIRLEPAGKIHAAAVGVEISLGARPAPGALDAMAERMAERIVEAAGLSPLSPETEALLLIPPLPAAGDMDALTFSGGVSEYVYGHQPAQFGDLGPQLAACVRRRIEALGAPLEQPAATIRATVVGASQYTVQLSGTTIFIDPPETVPLRNVPVLVPELDLAARELDPDALAATIGVALTRLDLQDKEVPVALGFHWQGSASFQRLHQFCTGVHGALRESLGRGQPLVLVSDGDIGGLIGLHLKEEMGVEAPVISVDGIELQEFDYIDIGELIPSSGAVPIVIKSLIFPASAG
jgi:ethanolamine utilization protein EutA